MAAEMERAAFPVAPSECCETLGRVSVEAFASATPVVGVGHGAFAEIVIPSRIGLHLTPGDPQDPATKVRRAAAHPEDMRRMGRTPAASMKRNTRRKLTTADSWPFTNGRSRTISGRGKTKYTRNTCKALETVVCSPCVTSPELAAVKIAVNPDLTLKRYCITRRRARMVGARIQGHQ